VIWVCRRRWWAVAGAALLCTLGWGILLHGAAATCPGGQAGAPPSTCGTFLWLDVDAFGRSHVYAHGAFGHDPEGLASTLGALATLLVGFAVARLIYELRDRPFTYRLGVLLAGAVTCLALTPVAELFDPFGKKMWTPAFVTLNAAVGLAVWTLLMVLFDTTLTSRTARTAQTVIAWPFEAVGRNALLLWIGLFLADGVLLHPSVHPSGITTLELRLLAEHGARWYAIVFFGAWFAVAAVMHATRWHVRL
jgi:predicted acyltransferase